MALRLKWLLLMNALRIAFYILFFLTISFHSLKAGPRSTYHVAKEEHMLMRDKVLKTFSSKLPTEYLAIAGSISDEVMLQSIRYKIEPMMITAIISGESSFNPVATGPVGEVGLMQLRPRTARWIAEKYGIKWRGASALKDPVYNIQLGSAYLGYLKKKYSPKEGLLYLAAYNMGETSLLRLLSNKISPNIYSSHIMKNYQVISI